MSTVVTKTESRRKVVLGGPIMSSTKKSGNISARTKATVTRTATLTNTNNNNSKNSKLKGGRRMSMIEERQSETQNDVTKSTPRNDIVSQLSRGGPPSQKSKRSPARVSHTSRAQSVSSRQSNNRRTMTQQTKRETTKTKQQLQ